MRAGRSPSPDLDEDYEASCRNLAGALARKRPSPLPGGRPETWACGIVRTIGRVDFLDDRSRRPHMKLTAIDRTFGAAEGRRYAPGKPVRLTVTGLSDLDGYEGEGGDGLIGVRRALPSGGAIHL